MNKDLTDNKDRIKFHNHSKSHWNAKQEISKTPCSNCSCKLRNSKNAIIDKQLHELYELRTEWKFTWRLFQCYMKNNWDWCKIHHNQLLRVDNNIERVKEKLWITDKQI